MDPTYTLAPTVGWTVIEMSAGLISACLPVLRPVVGLCFSKIGIEGLGSRSQFSSRLPPSNDQYSSKTADAHEMELEGSTSSGQRDNMSDAWFDDHDSEKLVQPTLGKLRPDHGFEYSASARSPPTTATRNDGPLRGITVRKDFSHTTHKAI